MKLSKQRADIDVRNFFSRLACSERIEHVTTGGRGCYVCEPVQ